MERDFLLDNFDPLTFELTDVMRIIKEVCAKHRVSYREMMSERRARSIAWPRQQAMYRLYKETCLSLPAIGQKFRRDHTTVMHAIKQVEKRLEGPKALPNTIPVYRLNGEHKEAAE